MSASTAASSARQTKSTRSQSRLSKKATDQLVSHRSRTTKCMDLSRREKESSAQYYDRARRITYQAMHNNAEDSGDNYFKVMERYPHEIKSQWYKELEDYIRVSKDGTNKDFRTVESLLKTEDLSKLRSAISKAALNATATGKTEQHLIKFLRGMERAKIPYNSRLVNFTAEPTYYAGPGKGNVKLKLSFSAEGMQPVQFGSSRIDLETNDLFRKDSRASRQMKTHLFNTDPPLRNEKQLERADTRFKTQMKYIDSQVYPDREDEDSEGWFGTYMDQMEASVVQDAQTTLPPSVSAPSGPSRADSHFTSLDKDTKTLEPATNAAIVTQTPSFWGKLMSRFTGGSAIPSTLQTMV